MTLEDYKQKKLVNANIQDIYFPDCCLNCKNHKELHGADYCSELGIYLDSVFVICNFHDKQI